MKKVLFLIMVYDNPIIMEEYGIIVKHYLEMKEKHHLDNFEIYGYTSGDEDGYDEEKHLFTFNIGIPESNYTTHIKTQKMFEYADTHFDFDYIFRTNTSTFCNIVLLNEFIENTEINNKTICGAEIYCKNKVLPNGFNIYYKYVRGNSIIIPRNLIQQIYNYNNSIIEKGNEQNTDFKLVADDDIIGYIFKDDNITLKSYFQEWLDSVNMPKHIFGNTNRDPNYLYNFIAIQFKSYLNRTKEIENLKYLCNIFNNYKFRRQHLWNVYRYYNGYNMIWIHPQIGYAVEMEDGKYQIIGHEKEKIINIIKQKG